MSVLIRTLPLSYGNYGGILQAWALQRAVRRVGIDAITDVSERPRSALRTNTKQVALAVRRLLPAAYRIIPGDAQRYERRPLDEFVHENLETTHLFSRWKHEPRERVLDSSDAFITGSDQVWRSAYADVPSFMFDFLDKNDLRARIAYAPSMGATNVNSWSSEQLAVMKPLLARFTALSVREAEAAAWIQETFGLDCQVMPDPTMLLDAADYSPFVASGRANPNHPSEPYILVYLLDSSPSAMRAVERISKHHALSVATIHTPAGQPRRRIEEWLALIEGAEFIITDSFHGTVFATLFNRPFATVINRDRGADRFTTFASTLGVQNRLAQRPEEIATIVETAVHWSQVNQARAEARARGAAFLRNALLPKA